MASTINTILIILGIVSFIISFLLVNSMSKTLEWKGYSSSWLHSPLELLYFIKLIREEKNKKDKKEYIWMLLASFFFFILGGTIMFSELFYLYSTR